MNQLTLAYLTFADYFDALDLSFCLQLGVLLTTAQEVSSALGVVHGLNSDVNPVKHQIKLELSLTEMKQHIQEGYLLFF